MFWTVTPNVGKTFQFQNLIDSAGRAVYPNPTSEETIIDFWFTTCPPCIAELKQFGKLLKGNEKEISIVSISIDGPEIWKNMFKTPNGRFDFINENLSNWQIVNLHLSDTVRKEKNFVESMYGMSRFPGYLVIDRSGKIIETPVSAVDYIRRKINGRSAFGIYITDYALTAHGLLKLLSAVFFYSGAFWSIIFSILYINGITGGTRKPVE